MTTKHVFQTNWRAFTCCIIALCIANQAQAKRVKSEPGGSTYQATSYHHTWSPTWRLSANGKGIITFTANATNDVIIGFSSVPEIDEHTYELVLGAGVNTWSCLRSSPLGSDIVANDNVLPTPGQNTDFWIIVDCTNNRIAAGTGTTVDGNIMVEAIVDDAVANVRYISFTNWYAPFTYSNIAFSPLPNSNPLWLLRQQLQLQRRRQYLLQNPCVTPQILQNG